MRLGRALPQLAHARRGDRVDDAERPALLFAQRYAEADGNPGPDARAALREAYDPETAADIRAFVHAIYSDADE